MGEWTGRGKGRGAGQPSVPGSGGVGAGGGRSAGQPSVPGSGGAGAGGGRSGGQPTISSPSSWSGAGKGRSGGQPSIQIAAWLTIRQGSLAQQSAAPDMLDPEGNFVFALEVDGVEIAHFTECSGLKTTTEVFEIQEGGMNDRVHKLPGQSKWENITLRYGVTSDTTLLGWRNEILQDSFEASGRRNGSIVIKNNQMKVVRRYNFKAAWPVSWEGPSLSASGSELAVEMLEIAHHGIEIT